jgi:SdrD B-like domain/Ice-binding-like
MPWLKSPTRARRFRPALERLEDRTQPAGFTGLGAASQFAVLGLQSTSVAHVRAVVSGDEAVSRGGSLSNGAGSSITGDVFEFAKKEYSGKGALGGTLHIDSALLKQADADAASAATAAAALKPTQTLGTIKKAMTVNGNGGLNVISIRGDVKASLTLSGSANDVFVVNVSGNLDLASNAVLGLGGAVTADHVLYNFTGRRGTVLARDRTVVNGTLLAPHYNVEVDGTLNGEVVGGGGNLRLAGHAQVNELPFALPAPPAADTSLAGSIYVDANNDGVREAGETGVVGFTVLLTGTDVNGNAVSLSATTDGDGDFSFTGLAAGTYTLTKQVPPFGHFVNGQATVGTVGGHADGTAQDSLNITSIVLHQGDAGLGYNFANLASG